MKKDKAYDLILYCKLLKYLRTTNILVKRRNGKIFIFKKVYNAVVKDMSIPYVTKSPWNNKLCFGLDYHPIYGYNMIVLFSTLKDVKL